LSVAVCRQPIVGTTDIGYLNAGLSAADDPGALHRCVSRTRMNLGPDVCGKPLGRDKY
jgi:hypothetical protein